MVYNPDMDKYRVPPENYRQRRGMQSFSPSMSSSQTRQLASLYMNNPRNARPGMSNYISNHANYHNVPFDSGDFSVSQAIKQFTQGVFSGFTTLNVGKHPDNEYAGIARSLGHLIGFAPGMVARPFMKVKALSGWARKLAGVKSVPMWGAEKIRQQVTKIAGPALRTALSGRADATNTVAKFLIDRKKPIAHIAEGAFDLGVASGISAWQGGVNEMMSSTFHGAAAGGVFRSLGNLVNMGDPTATKLTRTLAGSLYTGLQAEARGATTPEKVYEYLLGAFFGYGERPYYKAGAAKFMKKFEAKRVPDAELDITKQPELMGKEWKNLDAKEQAEVKKIITKEFFQGGDINSGRIGGDMLLDLLGPEYRDKYGNITKESWEKAREVLRGKPLEGLEVTEEGTLLKPAQERLVKKISDLNLKLQKDRGDLARIQSKMDIEDKAFKKTGEKDEALYTVFESHAKKLTESIARDQETLERLEKGIGDKEAVLDIEKSIDKESDVGEKTSNTRVGRFAEQFTETWLKDLYRIDVEPEVQADLKTVIAKRVDDIVGKVMKPGSGKTPDIDALAKTMQKDLDIPITPEARGELKQMLTVINKGLPQRYMRITYEPAEGGVKEKIVFQPMYLENPITKAGNKKKNREPLKVYEEIYLKESKGEIDDVWGNIVYVDHMSMKNKSGQWKDYTLSDMRKDNLEAYNNSLRLIVKKMSEKNLYLFGGRGDANKLIFIKYHPKTNKKEGKSFFRLADIQNQKDYKAAYKLFKEQFPDISEKARKKMFNDAIKSNILYDMGVQGYGLTKANFNKMWKSTDKSEFLNNALDYNKRLQITLTPAWAGSKKLADKTFKNDKGYKKTKGFNYVLVKDVDAPKEHKEMLFDFLAEKYAEGTDGAIIARRDVVNFHNEDSGNPKSGQNKSFIISPDPKHGALLGKFMFHKASPKLSELMEKQGIHYLIHNSSAKQRGTREVGSYEITPRGKLNINAPIYTLDPTHVKYSYSVKQGSAMYEHRARIPKQWFSSLNTRVTYSPVSKEVIDDIFNETISKSYSGEKVWNDNLSDYLKDPTPQKLNKLKQNLDKIGVVELLEAMHSNEGTRFADAAYEKLFKITKEMAVEDARENGIRESELSEWSQDLDHFDTVTKRMLQRAHRIAKGKDIKASSIYAHKWVRNYRLNVMRNYIMNHVAKPKIGNSAAARIRPYDKALRMDLDKVNPFLKELNKRDDIFFLDNDYRNMPIKTHLKGKWSNTTLGELWDAVQDPIAKKQFKGKEKEVEEIFRSMVVRVPMDSISGAHALKFRGFTGINGHGVLMPPKSVRALGGADLDADEAFIYFGGKDARNRGSGMKKEWKDAFEANKEEYVAYVSREPIGKDKKGNPIYSYLTQADYERAAAKDLFLKKYAKYIPDPKEGLVRRPDGKYAKDMTMADLLTEGASDFTQLSKNSRIAMYSPSVRLKVSEDVVNSRSLMGSVVSMTQTMKSAHDLISTTATGKDTFTFMDWNNMKKVTSKEESNYTSKAGNHFYVPEYEVRISARQQKEWLDYSRRLSASMTAFTADPMDTGGTKGYSKFFKELHDSYFKIENLRLIKPPGKKGKAKNIKIDNDTFHDMFKSDKSHSSFKLMNGTVKDFMGMNSALFGKNWNQGRAWNENEIRKKLEFINKFDSDLLGNITSKQAELLLKAPRWTDSIFNKVDKSKLETLYKEMNTLAEEYKFLAGMMGRSSFTIPPSIFIKKVLENNLHDPLMRDVLAQDSNIGRFFKIFDKLSYSRNRNETPESFRNSIKDLTKEEKLQVLEDVYHKAQDFMINDIHDMITLKRIVKIYDANKDVLTMKRMREIFDEVENTKKSSSIMSKNRNDTDIFYMSRESMGPKEAELYDAVMRKKIETGELRPDEISAEMDQYQIDARIKNYKANLNGVEKDFYDYLMLGTYNRNEMAKRSTANLDDPDILHDFVMKGARTSLTQIGFNSKSVSLKNIDAFIKDYMDLSAKTFKADKTELKKTIETSKKLEKVEIEVEGQDGPVKLLEKKSPEVKVEGYEEDLSGYIGLKKGELNKKQEAIINELAENLKYYSNGQTLKLNEITRGILHKDLNAMDFRDYKILNEVFKDHRNGTFAQRLFKEASPNMKRRFWMLFPEKVSKTMMKYDIEFIKAKGMFKTADGKWTEEAGWIRRPTWVLEGLMDWNGKLRDKATELGEDLQFELNSTLTFYADAIPEGQKLRNIAVAKMELGQINRILYGKSKSEETGGIEKSNAQRRDDAKSYSDAYLKEIGGKGDYKTAEPTGEAKEILEKTYKITHPDGTKENLTGWQVVEKIQGIFTSMNKRAHRIMTGDPSALDPYRTGTYFDKNNQEPKLKWRKFIDDIENLYQQGKSLPTNFGIDGLRQIARSMMIDLAPTQNLKDKLMKTKLSKTNKLDYSSYYPHMFHSVKAARQAMEKALENINNDSKMTPEQKILESKKVMMRTNELTGDWIDPGQDIWDHYDRAAQEILTSKNKRDEKVKWWDANQRMGNMNSRNSHIPGWDISQNTYDVYLRNVGNTYFNQMNQIFSRHMIEAFKQRMKDPKIGHNWHKEKTGFFRNEKGEKVPSTLLDNWVNFLQLYTQDAMGNPSIIPERVYSDPAMKVKGTPYYWWADNRVKKKLERMKKTILGKNASKYPHLDKLMETIDYHSLNRLSTLEAKFELASLLTHPKSVVGNMFGGSLHTVESAGFQYFKKGRDIKYLNKIFPEHFKSKEDIDKFVTAQGVLPEFILYQLGTDPKTRKVNLKEFSKDLGKKMSKTGELDEVTLNELRKKHKVTKPIMDLAASFMSKPERILRRDAFMAHYIKAYEAFDGAIKQFDHPFLIEIAKKGVKATQFLYSAPYRPAFSRSALGRVMTRFQLWQWNAVKFRNDIAKEAKLYGLAPGTPAYEKFTRLVQGDMFVFAMGNAFIYSIFDTAMPAPYAWYQDTADWLFGDERERDRAFFGEYPTVIAPIKLVSPPIARHPLAITKALYSGDWERFAHYHVYTMFPFGRMIKDVSPLAKNNLIDNPMGLMDKVGLPFQGMSRMSKRMRTGEGAWYPWKPIPIEE